MVEPEHPAWIDAEVAATLAGLSPTARKVMAVQGRHVSDRMAAARTAAEARTAAYQAAAADFSRHLRIPPRGPGYIPRVPRDTLAPLDAPLQPATTARSAA